jgi:RNA polymerase sigma-70 factor (ECF subfamily)
MTIRQAGDAEELRNASMSSHPEAEASGRETTELVEAAIDRLPESFRTVLMLRAVEGMTGAETAECLGVPEETVKTRLFRARALLHDDLERRANASFEEVHRFLAERCDRLVRGVMSGLPVAPTIQ